MTTGEVRVEAEWLALRERADASARALELAEEVRSCLSASGTATVHDLGCGTGSMARWLAPQLTGPQHWVMYDRDAALLPLVAASAPVEAFDGAPVTIEPRRRDITRLDRSELADADLITASALLDMLTAQEVERLATLCAAPRCPILITLSVTGRVDLSPTDRLDHVVCDAFNEHQRRTHGARTLLGPDAVEAAVDGFTRLGVDVLLRPSPWRLGPDRTALAAEWFTGWLAAACEQRPELGAVASSYARRRLAEIADGRLTVTVHHQDLLARPR